MGSVPIVVEQHAQEAAFLWALRDAAARAPHYALKDIAKLDGRVEAHIDGLRVAGDLGWEFCAKALTAGAHGEVFAASTVAFESAEPDRITAVMDVGAASVELSRGVVSALGWLPFQHAHRFIDQFLTSSSSILQFIGIAGSAIHRQDPGRMLPEAIGSPNAALRARALRAVGELGREDLFLQVREHLSDQDGLCRFWAARTIALLRADSQALSVLQSVAESNLPCHHQALELMMRRIDISSSTTWHLQLARNTQIRNAIVSAGAIGDPAGVSGLIEHMRIPKFSRVAGEAFAMITGVDLAYQDLETDKPEGFDAGPTENPEDENVEMDPDENLPWPDPELIANWWTKHQSEFQNGTRYLLGNPISVDWCQQVLRAGRQRQRAAAALELAIRQPGHPLFNVAAPGFRQQQMLGIKR